MSPAAITAVEARIVSGSGTSRLCLVLRADPPRGFTLNYRGARRYAELPAEGQALTREGLASGEERRTPGSVSGGYQVGCSSKPFCSIDRI